MIVDAIVVALIITYLIVGYRWGLVVAGFSLGGLALGMTAGWQLATWFATLVPVSPVRAMLLISIMISVAGLGQATGAWLGRRLRSTVVLFPKVTVADNILGSTAAVIVVCLVVSLVGQATRQIAGPPLSAAAKNSKLLTLMDSVMPSQVGSVATSLSKAISDGSFPKVFGVDPELITDVAAPDPKAFPSQLLAKVKPSVMKITGDAPECHRGQEGSGVVVSPQRVVTNAHVVAGVDHPKVQTPGGASYSARVVEFDPELDVAVLSVPGLQAPAIPGGPPLVSGAHTLIAGYPENGPYTRSVARVRSRLSAKGQDIYGNTGSVREVYSLRGTVEQGNSGGPLIDTRGRLAGIIFAKSLDDANTGYALTWNQIYPQVQRGVNATQRTSTGSCAAE